MADGRGFFEMPAVDPEDVNAFLIEATDLVAVQLPLAAALDPDDWRDLEFRIETSRRLTGRVLTPEGSAAVGALIALSRTPRSLEERARLWRSQAARPEVLTDVDGSFEVAGLQPGSWDLRVDAEGAAVEQVMGIVVGDGTTTLDAIQLQPQRSIEGRVTDSDGKPIEGAAVAYSTPWGWQRARID